MSDLKDFELAELRNGEPDADQCERAAKEIERHRAARAADAERVRSVVREAVELAATKAVDSALGEVCRQVGQMGHVLKEARREGMASPLSAIAHRAAEQLAGAVVGLSAEERDTLAWMRQRLEVYLDEGQTTKHALTNTERATKAITLLYRLLASPPDPTPARLALVEAFVAGAAYVQDHWYVGEQLSIELETGADIERAAEQHAARVTTAPDHTAAICALLDSDMPAGELRKALAELVGRR